MWDLFSPLYLPTLSYCRAASPYFFLKKKIKKINSILLFFFVSRHLHQVPYLFAASPFAEHRQKTYPSLPANPITFSAAARKSSFL